MRKRSFLAVILGLTAVLMFGLAGCGSSGITTNGIGGGTYGTLTLSGSGAAITGTLYATTDRTVVPASYTAVTWFSNKPPLSLPSFPYAVLMFYNAPIQTLTLANYPSLATPNGTWTAVSAASGVAIPGVIVGASSVTFNNVTLADPASATSTITLNGTLRF